MHNKSCGYWRCANRVGLFLALAFVVCFIWFFIHPVEQDLHVRLLQLSFYGYSGMNVSSFISGLIQSYIWAYIFVGLWYLVGCCYKGGTCKHD